MGTKQKEKELIKTLKEWVAINSWAHNSTGLKKMASLLKRYFKSLNGQLKEIKTPTGPTKHLLSLLILLCFGKKP